MPERSCVKYHIYHIWSLNILGCLEFASEVSHWTILRPTEACVVKLSWVQPKEITWHHIMPQCFHYTGKMADHMVKSYSDKDRGKPNYSVKNLSKYHFDHQKFYVWGPGIESRPLHDTAVQMKLPEPWHWSIDDVSHKTMESDSCVLTWVLPNIWEKRFINLLCKGRSATEIW